jgi:CBS domain-containing protein
MVTKEASDLLKEGMTPHVELVHPDTTLDEAAEKMG